MACTILVLNHTGRIRNNVSLARSPVSLLITSRDIQHPSGPSKDTTQSKKPPIPPVVYVYFGRASSSVIHTETRLGERASYHIHLLPAPQVTQADAPAFENVPAQHRYASVDRHETVRVAVLHQLRSAARRHARQLRLSSVPPFDAHSLVVQ